MTVSLAAIGVPQSLQNLIQDRTLERVFHDALFPRLLYRQEAIADRWDTNIGERMVFTRSGLMAPQIAPLVPGTDPTPKTYATEAWEAEAAQYGDTLDTHMPSSYVSLASLFLRNTQTLGLNAGQVLNRLPRNRLFAAYLSGQTTVNAVAALGANQVRVNSLNGFTENLLNGRIFPVSATNPLPVTFSVAGEPANTIIGATPDNPAVPFGPGVITLSAVLTVGLAVRDTVLAGTRARRLRVGGAVGIDGITAADVITLDSIISAVSALRANNVGPHQDGLYHVHVSPAAEAEMFRDNHFQRLFQSQNASSEQYRELMIGQMLGCLFLRDNENPAADTVSSVVALPGGAGGATLAPEIGAELTTAAGLPVIRTLVTGGGCIYEKYLDESKYITEAGVQGKIGEFSIVNGGLQVMTNRIRFILRSPQDRMQQLVSQSWSWSGDFPVPSDRLTGNGAAFKRAVAIEHS